MIDRAKVLERAIQLAIERGWRRPIRKFEVMTVGNYGYVRWHWDDSVPVLDVIGYQHWSDEDWFTVIFNHNFPKALWGENLKDTQKGNGRKYTLQICHDTYGISNRW